MKSLFLTVLNMSLTAGWLVLAVLALRLIFQKAPKSVTVVMWALVGIRLLCPFTLESSMSLLPTAEPVPQEILVSYSPKVQTGVPVINEALNPVISTVLAPAGEQTLLEQTPAKRFAHIAAVVWLTGAALMLLYAAFSYLRIRRKVREGMHMDGRLWVCDHISSPFILGIFRPRIYIPSSMTDTDLEYVLAHENAHLKRKDHWWKPLGFLLLCIHWFNPLLWVGYYFLCRDIELACDEAVLRKLGMESKKPYSEALLHCSISRRTLAACPLAFGEVGVKTRIKSVLNYKKPALWIILTAVLTCTVLAVCFLTDPKTEMSMRMDSTVRWNIKIHNRTEESHNHACCLDYELLDMKIRGRTTTLYLSVMYQEYSMKDGEPYQETSSQVPTVITLRQKDGGYVLKEYWEPRSGYYYAEDISDKFPMRLWDEALNIGQYAQKLKQSCMEQAWQQLKYEPPAQNEGEVVAATKLFDIDGDGIQESCTLSPGPDSERFTFTLSVFQNGVPEYCNTFSGPFYDLSFGTDPDGQTCLLAQSKGPDSETSYFYFELKDGNIQLYGRGCAFFHFGEQGISRTPWQVTSDLELAISRAVRLCHRIDQSEEGLFTQSYVVLEQEQLSGTPAVGQTDQPQEIKVYLLVLQMQYSVENGKAQKVSAGVFPTAITFELEEGVYYKLREYDNADGASEEMLKRLPPSVAAAAQNLRAYDGPLTDACDALADQLIKLQNTSTTADEAWMERYYRTMRSFPE